MIALVAAGFIVATFVDGSPIAASASIVKSSGPTEARFCGDTLPVVKPSGSPWKCLNDSEISHIRWTSWSTRSATGRGDVDFDKCVPDCARGKWGRYEASLTLDRPVTVDGRRLFSRMLVRFAKPVPHEPMTESLSLYTAPSADS